MGPDTWAALSAAVAASDARRAAASPASLLAVEAATYLERLAAQGKASVYGSGEALGALIHGGGNLPLYL